MRNPPPPDLELRILHGRRRKILQRKRLGKSWNRLDLAEIRRRIDELEAEALGVDWWRRELLWQLRARHFWLAIARAKELLERETASPSPQKFA